MFDVGCWLLDVFPSPVPAPRPEFSWFFPARAYPLLRHMAVESKPLFHPEVLRQQARSFSLREQTATWQPKLQHWTELITSGRADAFKETTWLPDFLTDIFCSLLGYTGPVGLADAHNSHNSHPSHLSDTVHAESPDTYTLSRERHVEVDGKAADAVLGRFQEGKEQFVAVLEGKATHGPLGPAFYGLRTSLLTLLLMALWCIKRPEGLKEYSPQELGRVLGLDRAPEVKTLRRKLAQLAGYGQDAASGLGASARSDGRAPRHGRLRSRWI
jgi:hypothetical protein